MAKLNYGNKKSIRVFNDYGKVATEPKNVWHYNCIISQATNLLPWTRSKKPPILRRNILKVKKLIKAKQFGMIQNDKEYFTNATELNIVDGNDLHDLQNEVYHRRRFTATLC